MIIKRGKRYGVRIYRAGRQEWVGTYPTKREAREAERVELGRRRASRDETCDSFAARWVEGLPASAGVHESPQRLLGQEVRG